MAILIVAYRSVDKLEKCLLSIENYLPNQGIHIWDNSGADFPGIRELAEHNQDINWYFSDQNIGFAAAVNKLAATVPDHDLLLLNPDAELIEPLTLTRAAINEPGVAAVAPMVWLPGDHKERLRLFSNRRVPWDAAFRRLRILNLLGGAAGLGVRFRGTPFSYLYRKQPDQVDGFLFGACLAICREAWDSVGPFDEEFFLYQEEAEWQRRATSAGWRLRLADEIGVRHIPRGTVSGDLDRSTRSDDLAFAGTVLLVEYCYGLRVAEFYLVWATVIESIKRRIRGQRVDVSPCPNVIITADGDSNVVGERVSTALTLAQAGYSVTFVSLQRLGNVPRDLPPSIRLIRRPWWWPSLASRASLSVLVMGSTRKERAFARLFRLGRNRTCIDASNLVGGLAEVVGNHTGTPSKLRPDEG